MEYRLEQTDKPCAILGCGQRKGNRVEAKFGYAVCEDHQHLTHVQVSNCACDPWARVRLLGSYPGAPAPTYMPEERGND